MNCPKCNSPTSVTNSATRDGIVYRRRKCTECGEIMFTQERIAERQNYSRSVLNQIRKPQKGESR